MLKLALIGTILIAVTVAIHATGTTLWFRWFRDHLLDEKHRLHSRHMLYALTMTAIVLIFLHALEIIVWAAAYKTIVPSGELGDFEAAVYFSFVTFTTLGYGDITLTDGYRLLSGIQALNGILLVGWSTALMFAVVQLAWQEDE